MKRFFALLLAICLLASTPISTTAAEPIPFDANVPSVWAEGYNGSIATVSDDVYIMATYFDNNFRVYSVSKQIYLESACVEITYRCTTEDGTYDSMNLLIYDMNNGGYNRNISLAGDGASHTVPLYLPAGYYEVQFCGNINHNHPAAAVNFKGLV